MENEKTALKAWFEISENEKAKVSVLKVDGRRWTIRTKRNVTYNVVVDSGFGFPKISPIQTEYKNVIRSHDFHLRKIWNAKVSVLKYTGQDSYKMMELNQKLDERFDGLKDFCSDKIKFYLYALGDTRSVYVWGYDEFHHDFKNFREYYEEKVAYQVKREFSH